MAKREKALGSLLTEIRACRVCADHLPLGPRPVLRVSTTAKLLIVGQAPGTRVHASGIPWDDPSGDRLREWLGMDREDFYNERRIAIIPVGLCYPGRGKSGDLPPRPECAPLWRPRMAPFLAEIRLTLLVGTYAQNLYLGKEKGLSLSDRVARFDQYAPDYFPLPHPSPRNWKWLADRPWFGATVLPQLRARVSQIFSDTLATER